MAIYYPKPGARQPESTIANAGDVAWIAWTSPSGRHGGNALALRCSHEYDESHWMTQTFGEVEDRDVTSVRPLVVIDPEGREQVERLVAILDEIPRAQPFVDTMQAAFRVFAEPRPPKPNEPEGLGAVVEDGDGHRWTRARRNVSGWVSEHGLWREWDRVPAVRVLSEGVPHE